MRARMVISQGREQLEQQAGLATEGQAQVLEQGLRGLAGFHAATELQTDCQEFLEAGVYL